MNDDGLDIPEWLLIQNRKPPTEEEQARIDAAAERAKAEKGQRSKLWERREFAKSLISLPKNFH